MTARAAFAAALAAAAFAGLGCASGENGRDLAAGWRGLLAIRGAQLGEPVDLPRAPYADAIYVGKVANRKLAEASGLALSSRSDDLLWSINDSGGKPRLFAFRTDGSEVGRVLVEDAREVDWEALGSFRWQDRAYLVVADTGDNFSWRRGVQLLVIEEPQLVGERFADGATTRPAWRVPFRFEDGPRDCEAVAVDAANLRAMLLSKRTEPPVLYELSLLPDADGDPAAGELRVARRVGAVPRIPPPTLGDVAESRWMGRYRSMPTGLDLSPDGTLAVVATYKDAYLFRRSPDEDWASAFARTPERIPLPPMRQTEGVAFGSDGRSLFVTSEKRPTPLFRLNWCTGPCLRN